MPVTAWLLLAANLVPLFAVLVWGWKAEALLWLYWLENLAIMAIQIVSILLAGSRAEGDAGWSLPANVGFAVFFALHFGFFCFIHGQFIATVIGGDDTFGLPGPGALVERATSADPRILVPLGLLAVSRLFSFYYHDLLGGRVQRSSPGEELFRPYQRIVVMHVVVLFGAMLALWARSALPALVLLVAIKLGLDLWGHLRQRVKRTGSPEPEEDHCPS